MSASIPPKDVHTNCSFPVTRFTSAATSFAQAMASPVIPGNAVAVRITVIMGHLPPSLRLQLLRQRLRLFQIARVEPLSEPSVHRSQQFARLRNLALVTPEACEAGCSAKFQQECALLLRDL